MSIRRIPSAAALSLVSLLALAACETASDMSVTKPLDSMMGKHQQAEARLSTAAAEAIAAGKSIEAEELYAKLHRKNPRNAEAAVNYAQTLRKNGKAQKAADILTPIVRSSDKSGAIKQDALPIALNEYAATQIALGNFENADDALGVVLENDAAKEFHADAYNLMGVALDARSEHGEAEPMFRTALEEWKGNPTSVMNNLALNLASQGMFDESLMTLRKALVMAPDKQEIARNIQIISDLRDSVIASAPSSAKKKKK